MTTFNLQLTTDAIGITCLTLFGLSYLFVITEEFTSLRKSKPVMVGASLIWIIVAFAANKMGKGSEITQAVYELFLEFSNLFLFLLVAMTYVIAIEERGVFDALKDWLVKKQFTYRKLFWIAGSLAFIISPIADNLTTALVMCSIILACGKNNPAFVSLSCINIVIGANAGGAFSPFGDITTLMVWQKEKVPFLHFFLLFLPSLVNFVVPAFFMHWAVPKGVPEKTGETSSIKDGGLSIVALFLTTIVITVALNHYLHLPPAFGMMTGLGLLKLRGYFISLRYEYDIFQKIQRIEWDTLLFFYGIMLCIGGLSALGYLEILSSSLFDKWGPTTANITIGLLSAIIDNIPLMFAVLTMDPTMSEGQWLLITLTAGVGGSVLSIGSAAGVALMGQAQGAYTFMRHLRWSWAIIIGYFAAIALHLIINKSLFHV